MSESVTVTLTEFLTDRLDEDEASAGQMDGWCGEWRCQPSDADFAETKRRTLAEVAAKRRIVAEHECGVGWDCLTCRGDADEWACQPWPCGTLRALASTYRKHEDWREEWE